MRCLAAAMLALLLTGETWAGTEGSLLAGGWSQHFGAKGDFNETHHGLGIEVEHDFGRLQGGGVIWDFTNSYDERSTYVGATYGRADLFAVCVTLIDSETDGACMVAIKLRNRRLGRRSWPSGS